MKVPWATLYMEGRQANVEMVTNGTDLMAIRSADFCLLTLQQEKLLPVLGFEHEDQLLLVSTATLPCHMTKC